MLVPDFLLAKILGAEADFKKGLRLLNAGKLMSSLSSFESAMKGYPEEGEYSAYYGYVLFRVKQKSAPAEAEHGLELIQKGMEQNPAAVAPTHWIPSNTAAWDHSYVSTHAASESVMRTFRTRAELC